MEKEYTIVHVGRWSFAVEQGDFLSKIYNKIFKSYDEAMNILSACKMSRIVDGKHIKGDYEIKVSS